MCQFFYVLKKYLIRPVYRQILKIKPITNNNLSQIVTQGGHGVVLCPFLKNDDGQDGQSGLEPAGLIPNQRALTIW